MKGKTESTLPLAANAHLALRETRADSGYGAVPALEWHYAVSAYRIIDDSGLDTVPEALDANVDHHQRQWL